MYPEESSFRRRVVVPLTRMRYFIKRIDYPAERPDWSLAVRGQYRRRVRHSIPTFSNIPSAGARHTPNTGIPLFVNGGPIVWILVVTGAESA